MDLLRNLTGARADPSEPPPSVLAEWNKYSTPDVETGGAAAAPAKPSVLVGLRESVTSFSSAPFGASSTAGNAPSFHIPTGPEFVLFCALVGASLFFYFISFTIFLPMLMLSPSKFALSFSVGSLCSMGAMGVLTGLSASVSHMLSTERLPFTALYMGSLAATVYSAVAMNSYLLSIVFSIVQVLALVYYVVSYFPGGAQGVNFIGGMMWRSVSSCLGSGLPRGT